MKDERVKECARISKEGCQLSVVLAYGLVLYFTMVSPKAVVSQFSINVL